MISRSGGPWFETPAPRALIMRCRSKLFRRTGSYAGDFRAWVDASTAFGRNAFRRRRSYRDRTLANPYRAFMSVRTESIVAPSSTISAEIQNHSKRTITAPSEP